MVICNPYADDSDASQFSNTLSKWHLRVLASQIIIVSASAI